MNTLSTVEPSTYRKPIELCSEQVSFVNPSISPELIEEKKKQLKEQIEKDGISLHHAKVEDVKIIKELIDKYFIPEVAKQTTRNHIKVCVQFGYSLVIRKNNNVVGFKLAIGYNCSPSVSQSFICVIEENLKGRQLGTLISQYSCLLGIETGAKIRKATVNPKNCSSARNLINKVGYYVESFNPSYFGFGIPRFVLTMDLDMQNLFSKIIDGKKVFDFTRNALKGIDFELVECENLEAIATLCSDKRFRIVALVTRKDGFDNNYYLAIPIDH